jgi:hypothetical protein
VRDRCEWIDAVSLGEMLPNKPQDLHAPQITMTPVYLGPDRRKVNELMEMSELHNAFESIVCHDEL